MTPQTVLDWLQSQFPDSSKRTLRQMVEHGRVLVNGAPARRSNLPLEPHDRVEISGRAERAAEGLAPLELVHEDDDILVVVKPAGLLTSTTPQESRPTALAIAERHCAWRRGRATAVLVHRLDLDASGLLLFAKNIESRNSLKDQFFEHEVDRRYVAVVLGVPEAASGRIESRLVERADGTMRRAEGPDEGQRAVTHYQVARSERDSAELRVRLETGKKHQIRVHLASIGHPVAGDRLYRGQHPRATRLLLHACELSFEHPGTGKKVRFESPPPPEFAAFLDGAGRADAPLP